jgi:hypothetical protein
LHRRLEAQIYAFDADMKQQVAGRGDSMAPPGANLAEGMQVGGPRPAKKPVPNFRPEPHDPGKTRFNVAKLHRA